MNIREELEKRNGDHEAFVFQDVEVTPERIRAVLINEVVPANPADDFYGGDGAAYLSTAIPLFQKAIYLTNAVKMPKTAPAIERSSIEKSLPYLEWELSLFPHVKVIMLMGDVAKKAFNMISKKAIGKHVIPPVSTYKIRKSEFWYQGIRIMPSYIMTGQNILIEKSKAEMAAEDISVMLSIIKE